MKKCPSCGREYSSGIIVCPNDEQILVPFVPPPPAQHPSCSVEATASPKTPNKPEVSIRARLGFLLCAWCVAGAISSVCLGSGPPGLAYAAFMFPLGWTCFAGGFLGLSFSNGDLGIFVFSASGWAIYVALSTTVLFTQRRKLYITCFTVLCVLLLLNVAGCNVLKNTNFKQ